MSAFHDRSERLVEEMARALGSVDEDSLDLLEEMIFSADRVFVAGKGKSLLQLQGFAMRLMHLGFTTYVVGEVITPALTGNDLLLLGSGSGQTASLIHYAEKADLLNAQIALITGAVESPLLDHAACVIHIDVPLPGSEAYTSSPPVLPLGSLFEVAMGLTLELLIAQIMESKGENSVAMLARHANLE